MSGVSGGIQKRNRVEEDDVFPLAEVKGTLE